jgi:hypothetical protein
MCVAQIANGPLARRARNLATLIVTAAVRPVEGLTADDRCSPGVLGSDEVGPA